MTPMKPAQTVASIFPARQLDLSFVIAEAERAEVAGIHIDIMDGVFAPTAFGDSKLIAAVDSMTRLPIEVHLQVNDPESWIPDSIAAGSRSVTFHIEATGHPERLARKIQREGASAGVGINPRTSLTSVIELIGIADAFTVMATDPGVSGFLPESLEKVRQLRGLLERRRLSTEIAVDGGVSRQTAGGLVCAGATKLVAGSSLWRNGARNEAQAIDRAIRASDG